MRADLHSYARPDEVRVVRLTLNLDVSFSAHVLAGSALLSLRRDDSAAPLWLDTRNLSIERVQAASESQSWCEVPWRLYDPDPVLGSALMVDLPADADRVLIQYHTSPGASGLQWLEPEQSFGRRSPFLYSQNQSIHARSWMPIQDSPGVRLRFTAIITAPPGLQVLMSTPLKEQTDDAFLFEMPYPVPAYLIALAVGNLSFSATGPRTGVYGEPSIISAAASEFSDLEAMLAQTESLYGPYRWRRYDVLVLPPSFPFGGMENPCLTFATPTILAGDKSLVGLIAHELAHSWSGNLVTNKTWRDFWLNEGFTTYIENRIQEAVYGPEQAAMERVLDFRELQRDMASHGAADQILHIDLTGRDPDEGCTRIPYVKGAMFLRALERAVGRDPFDRLLHRYFDHFAFQSIGTNEVLAYLEENLAGPGQSLRDLVPLEQWIFQPGLPDGVELPVSARLSEVAAAAAHWAHDSTSIDELHATGWSTGEWLEFLGCLPPAINPRRIEQLDARFHLTAARNDEITAEWLRLCIIWNYEPAWAAVESFACRVGRLKMIRPLYQESMKTVAGAERARKLYDRARPGYHAIARHAIDKIVGGAPGTDDLPPGCDLPI